MDSFCLISLTEWCIKGAIHSQIKAWILEIYNTSVKAPFVGIVVVDNVWVVVIDGKGVENNGSGYRSLHTFICLIHASTVVSKTCKTAPLLFGVAAASANTSMEGRLRMMRPCNGWKILLIENATDVEF